MMEQVYDLREATRSIVSTKAWLQLLIKGQPLSKLVLDELLGQSYVRFSKASSLYYATEIALPIAFLWFVPWSWGFRLFGACVCYVIPRMFLLSLMVWRRGRLRQELLGVLTLLLICVEMSDNFMGIFLAMSKGLINNRREMSLEIDRLCQDLRHRSNQQVVWRQFASKFSANDFAMLVDMLYANQLYGTDSTQNLKDQIDQFHEQRLSRIKQKSEQMEMWLKVAHILCFLPVMLMIIFGPLVINFEEHISPFTDRGVEIDQAKKGVL